MNDAADAATRVGSNGEDGTILTQGGVAILKSAQHTIVSQHALEPVLDLSLTAQDLPPGPAEFRTRLLAHFAARSDDPRDRGLELFEIRERPAQIREARRQLRTRVEKARNTPSGLQGIENLRELGTREQRPLRKLSKQGAQVVRPPERQFVTLLEQSARFAALGHAVPHAAQRLLEVERQARLAATHAVRLARQPFAQALPLEPLERLRRTVEAHERRV